MGEGVCTLDCHLALHSFSQNRLHQDCFLCIAKLLLLSNSQAFDLTHRHSHIFVGFCCCCCWTNLIFQFAFDRCSVKLLSVFPVSETVSSTERVWPGAFMIFIFHFDPCRSPPFTVRIFPFFWLIFFKWFRIVLASASWRTSQRTGGDVGASHALCACLDV